MSENTAPVVAPGRPGGLFAGNGSSNLDGKLTDLFASFGSVEGIRAASPIPRYAEDVLDASVVQIGRQRLTLVDDLISAGLTYPLPNWMSVMTLTYQRTNHSGHAKRAMEPDTRGERHVPDREYASIPIYLTFDEFSFGIRELLEAERVGAGLDTTMTQECTRNVNEAIEDQAINGLTTTDGQAMNINGITAPGALTAPAHQFEYGSNEEWTAAGHDGSDIMVDIQGMIDVLVAENFYGPFRLYLPRNYGSKMAQDFKTYSDSTIIQRLLEIPGLSSVKVADFLPDSTTLLLQMTSDVVDVIVGQTPSMVSWADPTGWNRFWCVLACVITRWKQNMDGGQGWVVGKPNWP